MKLHELIAKRNKIAADMRALHQKSTDEDRGFTSDERESWERMRADLDALDERIKVAKEADGLEDIAEPRSRLPARDEDSAGEEERGDDPDADYRQAFNAFLRNGVADLSQEQRNLLQRNSAQLPAEVRALAAGTAAAGGYTVPEGFGGRVIEAMLQYGGVERLATVLTTDSGNDIPFPTNDDTANVGERLGENVTATEQDTVFGQVTLQAFIYSSKMIRVPFTLLQDSGIDIEPYLISLLGKRLGRIQATEFATGAGTAGVPNGILTATSAGKTAAAAAAIAYSDLVGLEHSVDPAYRANGMGAFCFNDSTLQALKLLVDSQGRPLWLPSLADAAPATINGYRYAIDQGYESIATGKKVATFGDHSAFHIRRVRGIQMMRLAERYAEYFQVAFLGFNRADSDLLDTSAVKHLVMA